MKKAESRDRFRRERLPSRVPASPASARNVVAALSVAAATAVALPLGAQLPAVAVEETPLEFHLAADISGNGLVDTVIVDKVSGAFRLARQVGPGDFAWEDPRSSGVGKVTGATAGHFFNTSRHALAIASPDANRISFVDPMSATGPLLSDTPNAIGPLSIASGQIFGSTALEDLLLTSNLNSGPNFYRWARLVNQPAGTLAQSGTAFAGPVPYDTAGRVTLKTSLSSTVAFMQRLAASATLRVLSLNEPGSPVRLTVTGLPRDSRYVLVPFGGATHATLLTYVPGEATFTRRPISEDVPDTYTAGSGTVIALPYPVASITAVDGGGEIMLAILRDDGSEAAIYRFDGTALDALVQTITAPAPGQSLSGIVALGGDGGFQILHAEGPGRGTSGGQAFAWDALAGEFAGGMPAAFAEMAPRTGAGNVTLLNAEPFVVPTARPISLRNARDWTSGAPPVLPGSVDVTAEIFLGESLGLGNPLPVNLGSSPAGATHTLLNQYAREISVFTLSRAGGAQVGQVGISPAPGTYARAVELRFSSLPAGLTIFFRDADGAWQTYVEPGSEPELTDPGYAAWFAQFAALVRYKDTTIEYYGRDGSNRRTPIRRAEFRFTSPPDTLSSLGDNVPDYVKLGLGINPFSLPQGDTASGVANSLQAVLRGSGIDPRWLAGSAVDLYVRPLSHDGTGNASVASRLATNPPEVLPDGTSYAGNQIFLYSLSGGLLGQGTDPIPATTTRNEGLGLYNPPFAEPSALITSLGGAGNSVFLAATRPNFALAGTLPPPAQASAHGRGLIGLLPVSPPPFPVYTRPYTGGTDADEAAAWRAGAIAFYSAQPPPVVAEGIDSLDVAAALVFERWLLLRFLERGHLPPTFIPPAADPGSPPPTNPNFLTLSGFRARETALPMGDSPEGAVTPSDAALQALEQWDPGFSAYRLSDAAAAIRSAIATSVDPGIAALREVTHDIFRISAAHGNEFPGAFDPPIDVLRAFLATGLIPEPYTAGFAALAGAPFTGLPASTYTQALAGVSVALAAPQPRPSALLTVELRSDSHDYAGCLVVNELSSPVLYSLFNPDGNAFRLPASFSLLPGTRLEIRAFTDDPFPACVGSSLEVIELGGAPIAEVTLLPAASGEDDDGNLLGDEWELAFFGQTGVDPWEDLNGDGYTNLQKYLDGKDPFLFPSYSAVPPANLELPTLLIENLIPGYLMISFEFPEPYASALHFHLLENPALNGAWGSSATAINSPAPGQFEVVIPYNSEDRGFWKIGLSLK